MKDASAGSIVGDLADLLSILQLVIPSLPFYLTRMRGGNHQT